MSTIGSWVLFLGSGIVNDIAGEGAIGEPVEVVALPAVVALAVLVRYRRAVSTDRPFRGQLCTVAVLSGIAGGLGLAFASSPLSAVFWAVCATISIGTCALAALWRAP